MKNPQKLVEDATKLRNNGRGLRAIDKYVTAAKIYSEKGDKEQEAECWHMVGVSYKVENDIDKAVKYLETAASLHAQNNDEVGVGRAYRDIGVAYAYRKKYREAWEYLEKSVDSLKNSTAKAELGISEAKVGLQHLRDGSLVDAESWLNRGINSIREEGNWFYESTTLLHFGELHLMQRKYHDAVTCLLAAAGLIVEAGEREGQSRRLAQVYGLLAHGYLNVGNEKMAADYWLKAEKLLSKMKENVAEVVYEDIKLKEFPEKLRH